MTKKMKRVLLCMPEELFTAVDKEARYNFMKRSDLMRRALIWYLRPASNSNCRCKSETVPNEDGEALYTNPEELLKILNQQRLREGIKRMLREMKRQST
jgi:hypothetical protein